MILKNISFANKNLDVDIKIRIFATEFSYGNHKMKYNMYFQMSNHGKEEVAKGTLNAILRAAGLK